MIPGKNGNNIHATEESFRKHLIRRTIVMAALIISGIAIMIWLGAVNWDGSHEQDYTQGFFWGFSVSLIVACSINLVKLIRCMKNPDKFQKAYIEYTDERNMFVLMKSYFYSAYIFMMLMALTAVIVNFLGMSPDISRTLAGCIGVFATILAITYRIIKSKY